MNPRRFCSKGSVPNVARRWCRTAMESENLSTLKHPMPRTVDEGFRDFLSRLTPSSYESAAATAHRASIEARLKNDFGLRRFFRTGSFGNGTSISGYSDVDYFASLPR